MQHPLWREDGSVVYNCCWPSPAQLFSCSSPAGLITIFHCLRFETPPTWRMRSPSDRVALDFLFVASYDWQGYGGGIGTRLPRNRTYSQTNSPRYAAPARIAQKIFLPLLRVLSFPGKQRVHRAVPQQRLLYCRLFTQLLLGNGFTCHSTSYIETRTWSSWMLHRSNGVHTDASESYDCKSV
jgi:hypothetical protein